MRRPTRLVAALVVSLVTVAPAVGCSEEDDPRAALEDARYELTDIVDFWGWVPRDHLDMDWEPPAEVDGLAGGGSTDPRTTDGDGIGLADLDLENAARVHTDDAGGVWVLSYGAVVHIANGRINRIYEIGELDSAIAVNPELAPTVTNGTRIIAFEPDGGRDRSVTDRSDGIRPNAIVYKADGTLLAGGWAIGRLVAITDDGAADALLDLPDDVQTTVGGIMLLTLLDSGRIVVAVANSEAGFDLEVVTDRSLRPVSDSDGQPRAAADITSLAPAPDGRLLVTTPQQIEVVDVDTGESETLVDLDGAEGTASAAASGDDLVFLADGRLWHLPDAFA